MNDIIIPVAKSKIDHIDLKFVIRGIEKYVKNYREIIIIGEKPRWIQGIVHIPYEDEKELWWKERNIWRKIVASFDREETTDDVFFMNDDHFIIDEIDATEYPFYYKGTCKDSVISNKSFYRCTMNHTLKLLSRRGFLDRNADTHCPIIYNRKEFLSTFDPVYWETKYGYGIKSVYCAFNKKEMVYMPDCKITKKITKEQVDKLAEGRHVISCTDAPMKVGLREWLEEKFPEKSSYEK